MPNGYEVLEEISAQLESGNTSAFEDVRQKYLQRLYEYTNRNVIAYYSGFLSNPHIQGIAISDDDKNGFMTCVHKMDRSKGLDLFLHTPGGDLSATESLIHYLKEMFGDDIRAVIPQISMSAGTLLACACNSMLLGKQSNIGPVDPQINGIPAIGVLFELRKALDEIKKDVLAVHIWRPIISKLSPGFVQQCEWAIEKSEQLLRTQLANGMLKDYPTEMKESAIQRLVDTLLNLDFNKTHDRHIHYQECIDLGLLVDMMEYDAILQDLVLTVHHCYVHTLANTNVYKIIENQGGQALIKRRR